MDDVASDSEILDEIEVTDGAPIAAETARSLLAMKFGPKAISRMNELAAKNRDGALSDAERRLMDRYLRVGGLLNIIHARARAVLDRSAFAR